MDRKLSKYPTIDEIDMDVWCQELGCTEDELNFCIKNVGTSWVCVEAFWCMNKWRIHATLNKLKVSQD